jgi:hypothetical protein
MDETFSCSNARLFRGRIRRIGKEKKEEEEEEEEESNGIPFAVRTLLSNNGYSSRRKNKNRRARAFSASKRRTVSFEVSFASRAFVPR